MSATYQNFRERLKEERLRLELSQLEIGQALRMSQSHYSKVEIGTRRLTFFETQYLCEANVDVYYLFTGEKRVIEIDNLFIECNFDELVCYLHTLCMLLTCLHGNKSIILPRDMQKKLENIQYALMPCEKRQTIFYKLRRALNYNQIKMADLLEVDVKKLRGMESGKILPDNEIIWRLSEMFYIPYALLLKDKNGLVCELNCLLDLIKESKRKDVLEGIKYFHNSLF